MPTVTIRYWAAAKQAAGLAEEAVQAPTLAAAIAAAVDRRADGQALRTVLDRSSFLIDGSPVGRRAAGDVLLPDAAVIEVLPPFAGG